VPIVDTVTVITKRLMKSKNPFHADKRHLHHILLKMGYSNRQSAAIIIPLSALFSSIAIAGALLKIPEYYLFFYRGVSEKKTQRQIHFTPYLSEQKS
jgi:UDP-GlcNAc:undecaprenyl-phosphate/decaprenyl-phosphate GlcNAc-1-phosphate transferase